MARRVFISYSHDSAAHVERVLALAQALRNDGVDVRTDRDALQVPEGWPTWLQRQFLESDHVVLVCTDDYRRRFEGDASLDEGKRATWEGMLAKQILFDAGSLNTRMIPVLFAGSDESAVPLALAGATRHRLPEQYEDLYRHITNQPRHVPAPLGQLRVLPPVSPGGGIYGDNSNHSNAVLGRSCSILPCTILLLTANAGLDGVPLLLEEELREIIDALRGAARREHYAHEIQPAVDFVEVIRLLDERAPTIAHFCGHGDLAGLYLKGSATTTAHVAGEHVVELFASLRRRPRLVVFAACRSAALAEAVAAHVEFTIGYGEQLPDATAREFSRIFYDRLAARPEPDIAHAFRLTQLALISAGLPGAEHARLFQRRRALTAGAEP